MALLVLALGLFLTALLLAGFSLAWLRQHAARLRLLDRPGGRKDHERPTAVVGGLAIMAAVGLPAFLGLIIALLGARLGTVLPAALAVHLPGIASRAPELLAILAGSALMMGLGYLDDRRGLSPWLRLIVQLLAASLLFFAGVRITLFVPSVFVHGVLTVLFVAFLTNAVNFIDNMNGLSSGTILIGATHLLALAIASGQLFLSAILICLIGGLVAFLPNNYPTARVFLGDAGSLALGFLMAGLTISFTFEDGGTSALPIVLPLLILAVPFADGVTVIITRLLRGVHPFTAGHDHLSHRLVRRGLSRTAAVGWLWGVGWILGFVAALIGGTPLSTLAIVWGAVFLGLWSVARFRR